jgi:hypothetical protein
VTVDPNQLYHLRQPSPDGFDVMSSADFMASVFVEEPAGRPQNPLCPTGEWYCMNEDCDVHEVRVAFKHYDGLPDKRPALRCPSCRQPMNFNHYLHTRTLVPKRENQ